MDIFGIINLLGGLSLFLFGMNVMGEGLTNTAGGKLEILLEKLSSTPLRGMLLGTAVTGVIQSSSATTVMVVGFVNSGIMKLTQAIGVILGANLGTTVTAWILSLVGISGDNLIIKLLKPSSFAPILGVIGIVMYSFMKSERKKYVGGILIGFAVLMTGMEMMGAAVAPLADSPSFTNILLMFSSPILGLIAGLLITAIIQSSSASIGILQALSLTGAVSFGTAIPIIMGQNIGTCVTALISSVGTSTNAKRAAFVHLYFNTIMAFVFMAGFYILNSIIHFNFVNDSISPVGIAMVHTLANLIAISITLPFTKGLEKLAMVTIKDKSGAEDKEFDKYERMLGLLDNRFLETPPLAVEQCLNAARYMAVLTKKCTAYALELIGSYTENTYKKVDKLENAVDIYEDRLGTYIVLLSQKSLTVNDSNKLSIILHSISNLERISDHAKNIAQISRKMNKKGQKFSEECVAELEKYRSAVCEIVCNINKVFDTFDIDMAKRIEPLEEVIDNINDKVKRHHVHRLREGVCTVDMGVHFDNVVNDLERIADHCSNIAVTIIEISENVYETHEYIDILKRTQSEEFTRVYREYDEKFHL